MNFSELGLCDELSQAVADLGYTAPTPIQEKSIPYVLMGRDILGSAQTGTGKTASFTLPMIEILASGRAKARLPRSLILAPTRELAAQVADSFEKFSTYHKLSMALLIGGVSFADQNAALDKGVDVLIATPGRLLDHFERGKVLLNDVKILVIDEADRMLDMGFIPDVERIVSLLPRPGGWMNSLKLLMGLGLSGTVIWLVWLISLQTGSLVTLVMSAMLFGLSACLYSDSIYLLCYTARLLPVL